MGNRMKKMKKYLSLLLTFVMILTLWTPVTATAASNGSDSSNVTELEVGESKKLQKSGFSWSTTWESSDETIVKVSSNGTVTGISPGEATVTASSRSFGWIFTRKEKVQEFDIIVVEGEEVETIEIGIGENVVLDAPSRGTTTWTSSNKDVATVSDSGTVTGVSAGETTVMAKTRTGGFHFWFISWGGTTTTTEYHIVVVDNGETPDPDPEPTPDPDPEPGVTEYTVTFESNGGSEIEAQVIAEGEKVTEPEDPTKEGCAFLGWYLDEALTEPVDFETVTITKDTTFYALWLDVTDETDTDDDEISDNLEEMLGLDPTSEDTDGDGLNDFVEIDILYMDPLKADTDGNGIPDGQEDNDEDGLLNLEEIEHGTDPMVADSDDDNLSDYDEIHIYTTDPLNVDTDGDGASDGKEVELGTDPLVAEESFHVVESSSGDENVTASVEIDLSGEQVESLEIESVENPSLFPEEMPGYIGSAYDFNVDGEFDSATISFEFDPANVDEDADLTIYYFNEDEQSLEELETVIEGNVASAVVNHFSTYILIDRAVYNAAFKWEDNWDTEGVYHSVEIVLVIDDSGSMTSNDREDQRLTVAQNLIDKLPEDSKIGVVSFDSGVTVLTQELTADREAAKAYLTTEYFASSGGTNMYTAINSGFDLFESTADDVLKMMVVLSDGNTGDTGQHASTITTAQENSIRIYTVGLGSSTSYFNNYLKPLAESTNAEFYLAENADQLAAIYENINKRIDIESDDDGDGIPNYYEDNMIAFNGMSIPLDKNNPDTDGDGLLDGEEITLTYEYNEDRTKVLVKGEMSSNPALVDSDGDGLYDNEVRTGYRTGENGVEEYVVAPIDDEKLIYTGAKGMWKTHIEEQQNAARVAGAYGDNTDGFDFDLPAWADKMIVDAALFLQTIVSSDGWEQSGVEKYIHSVCTVIKFFCGTEAHAVVGAYLLNFVYDNLDIAYHSQPDTWQKDFGYNDFYDSVFRIGSEMEHEYVPFDVDGAEYVIWMWKGDYWNLQTGAEIGLYKYDHSSSGESHYEVVDFELPMTLSLYNYYSSTNIDNVFNWAPEVEQWWITGFNTDFEAPVPEDMTSIASIDFTGKETLFNGLMKTVSQNNYGEYFIFDEENHIAWILWE